MQRPGNVFLIGYRGTGKTTVARLLAQRLACEWIDADDLIEKQAGKSIAEIFAEDGEEAFRDLEEQVVAESCRGAGTVVALGGGATLRPTNRDVIAQSGTVVWLTASLDTLAERLAGDPTTASRRPNLTESGGRSEIEALLAQRTPFYQACATFAVDTDRKEPDRVVDEIVALLGSAT